MSETFKIIAQGAGEFSPTCREAIRLQSEALERPLTFRERVGLKIHLVLCRWCKRYGIQIRFLRTAARRQSDHTEALPSQNLSPEARERIKVRLKDEQH